MQKGLGFRAYKGLGFRACSSKQRASTQGAAGRRASTARALPTPGHPGFILLGFRVFYGAPSRTLNKFDSTGEGKELAEQPCASHCASSWP